MKFRKILELEQVEQWKEYVDYYFLKQCIKHHVKVQGVVLGEELVEIELPVKLGTHRRPSIGGGNERKMVEKFESFEEELSKEVAKVDQFFRSRHDKFLARLQELTNDIELMKSGNVEVSPHTANALRQAYHDNHVQWKLLRKFQETNKFGFVKILKKYDHEFRESQFDYFLDSYLQITLFWNTNTIENILTETKQVYTKYFAASDERLAKSQLRRSDAKREQSSLFFVALFLGIVAIMFVVNVYNYVENYPTNPPDFAALGWFVYRISLLPILLAILFSLSTYIWEKHNINYVFIFKFDPTHYRSPLMYLKYGLCALSVWTLSFFFFLDAVEHNIRVFYGLLQPLIFAIAVVVAFFLPLPIFGYRTRFYLIRKISRVLRAGLPGKINVSFSDFIMAINLIALSEFFLEFQIMFCMFGVRDNSICSGDIYALPFLNALPHCYPHLASAIRPFSSLISLTLSVVAKKHPDHHFIITLWLVCNSMFSVVRWYSDLLIDFGFVKFGLDFTLRKQRLYPTWIYYFVMVDNFCLRYAWLIVYMLQTRTSLNLNHPITLLFLSTFDLIWGFQFVFFRMENEHFNCSDRYNIIQDVPLPFTKKYDALARKNASKKVKRDNRKLQATFSWFSKIKSAWLRIPRQVESRKKLRESIARAIQEVERDHPSPHKMPMKGYQLDRRHNPSLSGTPFSSYANLSVHNFGTPTPFTSSANLSWRHIGTPYASTSNLSFHNPLRINPGASLHLNTPVHSPLHSPTDTPGALSPNQSRAQSPAHSPVHSPTHSPNNSPLSSRPTSPAIPHLPPYSPHASRPATPLSLSPTRSKSPRHFLATSQSEHQNFDPPSALHSPSNILTTPSTTTPPPL